MRDVADLLLTDKPVLVVPHVPARSVPWLPSYHVEGFVLTDGVTVLRKPAEAAPFIANAFPALTVLSLGPDVLQWFDARAATRPAQYVDLLALREVARAVNPLLAPEAWPWAETRWSTSDAPDEVFRDIYRCAEDVRACFKADDLKAYQVYADQYLKAHALLALMTSRGYDAGPAFSVHKAEDGYIHPTWTIPTRPGRVTTKAPSLHALRPAQWETMRAQRGWRWVRLVWPGVVTVIARHVVGKVPSLGALHTAALALTPSAATDWALGAPYLAEPADPLGVDAEDTLVALRQAWQATATPYLFPVPADPDVEVTSGKLALRAASAFTLAQLAVLYDAHCLVRHRALTGLQAVIPGLGSLLFQIDDRVPLEAVRDYVLAFHAHHVVPEVTLGTQWASMVPLGDKFAEVALQLERPTQTPVQCPVCLGSADSERDLATHFVEDHGYAR